MNCCGGSYSTRSPPYSPHEPTSLTENRKPENPKHETLLQIPGCTLNLIEEGEAVELARGSFSVLQVSDEAENLPLATIIKVGEDFQWPLTKDEPVVKLNGLNYLFSIPIKEGRPLSYGVSFHEQNEGKLGSLDLFLKEKCCFSWPNNLRKRNEIDWKEFAPKIEDYKGVLAKAIVGGTGHIVKGIFICGNAYTNQVQKGGETVLSRAAEEKNSARKSNNTNYNSDPKKQNALNQSIKRAKKLSMMTEKMSKGMLNAVGVATGSIMGPVVRSKPGKAFFSMMPGEVLLASLDAVDKIMNAAEAAQTQALGATSAAAVRMVSNRYGENAGEATGEVLATVGHTAGTAWNVFKIRKALNPASSASSGVLKSAPKYMKS